MISVPFHKVYSILCYSFRNLVALLCYLTSELQLSNIKEIELVLFFKIFGASKVNRIIYYILSIFPTNMLTKEEVDSWNVLFPDCQINNTNLANPTEQFLTHALVVYLRRFGFQIEPPFNLNAENKENNKETRLFLIKLSRQIDHFLKLTDKSYAFTYYDLIRPTPKKTAHLLYILLNYFYYYNLYKEDVFKTAGDGIRKLEELKGLIDDTRRDNENRVEESKNLEKAVEMLKNEVPTARATFSELEKNREAQEEEIQKLSRSYHELKEKLQHLEEQKKLIRKRLVADDEVQELQRQLQQLKIDLKSLKETELKNVASLNECKESNANLQNLNNDIERAIEILPLRLIEQFKETNKQLKKCKKDQQELQAGHNAMQQEIDEEKQKCCAFEIEQQNKSKEFELKKKELLESLNDKQMALKQKSIQIKQLQEEEHITECQLEEQKDIAQYLVENISEILSAYEN
ncbi:hypothetical protein DOY81_005951 [Sarcophaga bullata]|nr:hypothetical protein DOY81_005951 [Sarcophaga bullata]